MILIIVAFSYADECPIQLQFPKQDATDSLSIRVLYKHKIITQLFYIPTIDSGFKDNSNNLHYIGTSSHFNLFRSSFNKHDSLCVRNYALDTSVCKAKIISYPVIDNRYEGRFIPMFDSVGGCNVVFIPSQRKHRMVNYYPTESIYTQMSYITNDSQMVLKYMNSEGFDILGVMSAFRLWEERHSGRVFDATMAVGTITGAVLLSGEYESEYIHCNGNNKNGNCETPSFLPLVLAVGIAGAYFVEDLVEKYMMSDIEKEQKEKFEEWMKIK